MASEKQTSANRRNAAKSTVPITLNGKLQSRRNALRHGLTAATVVPAMEDAEEFEQFEAAIKADYQPISAVEHELVSRLTSLFWRLRRTTLIETSLFELQGRGAIQHKFGPRSELNQAGPGIDMLYRLLRSPLTPLPSIESTPIPELADRETNSDRGLENTIRRINPATVFLRLCHLNSFPIERINRYETALWRQAVQTLFLLDGCRKRSPCL